jgi:hypothetical protein
MWIFAQPGYGSFLDFSLPRKLTSSCSAFSGAPSGLAAHSGIPTTTDYLRISWRRQLTEFAILRAKEDRQGFWGDCGEEVLE